MFHLRTSWRRARARARGFVRTNVAHRAIIVSYAGMCVRVSFPLPPSSAMRPAGMCMRARLGSLTTRKVCLLKKSSVKSKTY